MIGTNLYTAIGLLTVLGLMVLGLISTFPATVAFQKGHKFIKWYIFSFLMFPVALIMSFVI